MPNAAPVAVGPPSLPAPYTQLLGGFPAQGAVPTYDEVDAVDQAYQVVKRAKNARRCAGGHLNSGSCEHAHVPPCGGSERYVFVLSGGHQDGIPN